MKKFFSNSLIVAIFLFISKILGFIRDMLMATFFGTGIAMQAFLVAFRLPEFMRKISSSGAITQILNPYIKGDLNNKQKQFIVTVLFFVAVILLFIIILAAYFSKEFVSVLALGFIHEVTVYNLCVELFKIMIPYTLFIFIVSLMGAVLNSYSKYIVASVIPLILNVVMIAAMIIARKSDQAIYFLAYSVFWAGVIQLLIATFALYHLCGRIVISKSVIFLKDRRAKIFFKRLPSAFVGASVLQISSLIETLFASFLISGSLGWLYYADRVNQFLYGFGTAIATVMIPHLIQCRNEGELIKTFNNIVNSTLIVVLPAICGLVFMAKPIIITLFNYGVFSQTDVNLTTLAIFGYAISLLCFVLIRILTSTLYVKNKVSEVYYISIVCLIVNVILGVLVVVFLSKSTYAFLALACVTSIVAVMNLISQMLLLSLFSMKRFLKLFIDVPLLLKITLSLLVMLVILNLLNYDSAIWYSMDVYARILNLSEIIILATAGYFSTLGVVTLLQRISSKE